MKTKARSKVVSILNGKKALATTPVASTEDPNEPGKVLLMPGTDASDSPQKINPRARIRTIDAYKEMVRVHLWDDLKLRKALEKRGINSLSYFPDEGFELTLFLPLKVYKKKDRHRILVRFKLAPNATYFSASLIVKVAWETVELHKPIRIPVVDTVKAQTDEVMRAYHALYDGVYCVIGVEALPGWPGLEGLAKMHQKVALSAKQCLNRLNTMPKLE